MINRIFPRLLLAAASVMMSLNAVAQEADSSQTKTVITLDEALKIALSENASVQVADKEIAPDMPRRELTHLFSRRLILQDHSREQSRNR